jgi:hypothetical protein
MRRRNLREQHHGPSTGEATMKTQYHLDAISSTLNVIGTSLACEGIRGTPGFAEELKTIERKLRQLYSDEFPKDPFLFAAALAVNAMALGIAAAEA